MKINELREQRAKLHHDLNGVLALPPSAENNEKARKLLADANDLKSQIDKLETRGLSTIPEVIRGEKDVEQLRAFANYLRMGENASLETKATLRAIAEGSPLQPHVGTYSGIGYFVPTSFSNAVEVATKWYANLLGECGSIETGSGSPLPYPTNNDTTATASLLTENSPVSDADITASQVVFGAHKYTSGLVRASLELVDDSYFDISAFVAEAMGNRFGRKFEDVLTNGSGSSQPTGILTAIAASGATPVIATGSNTNDGNSASLATNSIGSNDLVNLEHAVDKSYRRGAKYMMHDLTLAKFQQVLDKFGRPLFVPGISGQPDTLNGYPVIVNNGMPVVAASATPLAFGDFSKFKIRRVKDFQILVLRERYAEYGQIGYTGFARIDSNLVDAGTHPIKLLQMAS